MSLDDLLPQNRGNNKQKKSSSKDDSKSPGRPGKEIPQLTFSVRHDVSTKILLDKIQKIMELTEPQKVSQGDIVRQALNLLAEELELPKKEKKYTQFMKFIEEKYKS
jgi:hypothetical protein